MVSKLIGRLACALALLLLAAAAVSGAMADAVTATATATAPQVTGAWVQLSPVAGRPAAGYFTLRGGAVDDRLVAVTSPRASRAELHTSAMANGMMHMGSMASVAVPAHQAVAFAPGGSHVMLYDAKPVGTTLPLVLTFASGAAVRIDAETRAAGR